MRVELKNEQTMGKTFVYEENFWTGRVTLTYDGNKLEKVKRNHFKLDVDGKAEEFVVSGNQVIGVKVSMFDTSVEVARKPTWYEWFFTALICMGGVAIIIAGSCMGNLNYWLGVLFGAVCGAITGGVAYTNIALLKRIDKLWIRLVVGAELVLLDLALCGFFAHIAFKAF